MSAKTFNIEYSKAAANDVKQQRKFDQKKILDGIETHLRHEPTKTSHTRIKLMDQPFWSEYRLRVEDFRVYYDVDEALGTVDVLRVFEKGQSETRKEPEHETD